MMRILVASLLLFSSSGACGREPGVAVSCNEGVEDLLAAMSSAEPLALETFVRCRSAYEGGNLGDLYRAAGGYISSNPDLYLKVLTQQKVSEKELSNFLIMLPLSLVDNIEGKKSELEGRIESIRTVEPSDVRAVALRILEEHLRFLSSIED